MFSWLKRDKKENQALSNWNIGNIQNFERIQNPDSIQYLNKDAGIVIYFSVLVVSGNNLFTVDTYPGEPTISEDNDGWQLKGAKKSKNEILVCVISIKKHDDIAWAKVFFDSIKASLPR